jgi:hypothetical protein
MGDAQQGEPLVSVFKSFSSWALIEGLIQMYHQEVGMQFENQYLGHAGNVAASLKKS